MKSFIASSLPMAARSYLVARTAIIMCVCLCMCVYFNLPITLSVTSLPTLFCACINLWHFLAPLVRFKSSDPHEYLLLLYK